MPDDPEIIDSPLSRLYSDEGKTVEVCIYRLEHSKWTLEVRDLDGNHTLWDDEFETDQQAWEEFLREVDENGIEQFIGEPPASTLH